MIKTDFIMILRREIALKNLDTQQGKSRYFSITCPGGKKKAKIKSLKSVHFHIKGGKMGERT